MTARAELPVSINLFAKGATDKAIDTLIGPRFAVTPLDAVLPTDILRPIEREYGCAFSGCKVSDTFVLAVPEREYGHLDLSETRIHLIRTGYQEISTTELDFSYMKGVGVHAEDMSGRIHVYRERQTREKPMTLADMNRLYGYTRLTGTTLLPLPVLSLRGKVDTIRPPFYQPRQPPTRQSWLINMAAAASFAMQGQSSRDAEIGMHLHEVDIQGRKVPAVMIFSKPWKLEIRGHVTANE